MKKIEKRIAFLKDAKKNCLTEETIKNLSKIIRNELESEEKYEDCDKITKLENKLLKSFKHDKKKLVTNVGLSKKELDDLMNL